MNVDLRLRSSAEHACQNTMWDWSKA